MPVTGRKPKPEAERRNRMPPTHDWSTVLDVPFGVDEEGKFIACERPSLPVRTKATQAWWAAITTMPHCVLWRASDWQFAVDTARVHARFIRTGRDASELRNRERLMGTTEDSRRDLRIRYVPAGQEEEADERPTAIDDYRARLGAQ